MLKPALWETANGVLSILGVFLTVMVIIYLLSNIEKTYRDPVRFITIAFAAIILGHTIKDSSAYLARCCGVTMPDWAIVFALTLIALGKLGCIRIWTRPSWGHWPWIIAVALVAVFLIVEKM